MANIMINEVCNLSCPYCFANKYVNGDNSTNMSFENFQKAVDWIVDGDGGRIGIIGGEPTLHPEFISFLDYAVEKRKPSQSIHVFSNGIEIGRFAEYFGKNNISVLLNVNRPEVVLTKKQHEKLLENIGLLRKHGVEVSIGINLYEDFDYGFIKHIVKEFSFKDLRVGITCPNSKELVRQGSLSHYKTIKPALMRLIKEMVEMECDIHLDCQKIPRCVFTEEELCELEGLNLLPGMKDILHETAKCHPVIDILQDLKAVRCFGCSDKALAVPISIFKRESDVAGYYQANLDSIANFVSIDPKCDGCYMKRKGDCQAGCISFKLDKTIEVLKIVAKETKVVSEQSA